MSFCVSMEVLRVKRSTLEAGTTLGGTYSVGRIIGQGGMGEVYEARHARLAGRYAVKVIRREVIELDPITIQRFQREAEVMSSLRHPNVVQIIDFDVTADGSPFIVMEYLDGSSLQARMEQRGPMPIGEVLSIVEQIASALAAAHERSIVHRDLKPANIFLVPLPVAVHGQATEFVKVLDFGISKVRTAGTLTGTPRIMGTPHYMAPEQARAQTDDMDGRADQFSLAAIIYELLSGRKAFPGDTIEAALYSVVHEKPASLAPVVGELVDAVLTTALSKDRAARYPSITAFVAALRAASARTSQTGGGAGETRLRQGITFETDSSIKPAAPGAPSLPAAAPSDVGLLRRRTLAVIAAAGTAAAIVAAGVILMNRRGRTETPALSPAELAQLGARVRERIEGALAVERQLLETRLRAAAKIPELRSAAITRIDAFTFNDLFATEDWWQPYRDSSVFVFDGERPLVTRGAPDITDAGAWRFWKQAQGHVATAIVAGQQHVYLGAGTPLDAKGSFGLVLAEHLDAERLAALAKRGNFARLIISDGKRLYPSHAASGSAGGAAGDLPLVGHEAEGVLALPGGQVAVALAVPRGVWVWAVVATPGAAAAGGGQ